MSDTHPMPEPELSLADLRLLLDIVVDCRDWEDDEPELARLEGLLRAVIECRRVRVLPQPQE